MSLSFLASREETRRARFLEGDNFRVRSRGSLALPYFTITRSLETDPYCGKVRGSIVERQKSPEVGYSARSWSNPFPMFSVDVVPAVYERLVEKRSKVAFIQENWLID